jgi:hypothetical protein
MKMYSLVRPEVNKNVAVVGNYIRESKVMRMSDLEYLDYLNKQESKNKCIPTH